MRIVCAYPTPFCSLISFSGRLPVLNISTSERPPVLTISISGMVVLQDIYPTFLYLQEWPLNFEN